MTKIAEKGTLKLARVKEDTVDGIATILLKAPGTVGADPEEGRIVVGGQGWFQNAHADDYFEIYITDEDNILGGGAGVIIGGYTEIDLTNDNKGWYFSNVGLLEITPLTDPGFVPAGFYLKIIAVKGDLSSDTLRVNVKWGKRH